MYFVMAKCFLCFRSGVSWGEAFSADLKDPAVKTDQAEDLEHQEVVAY